MSITFRSSSIFFYHLDSDDIETDPESHPIHFQVSFDARLGGCLWGRSNHPGINQTEGLQIIEHAVWRICFVGNRCDDFDDW